MGPASAEPEIITRNGKPVSVILPIKQYEELIERAEDAGHVAWLKKMRKKPLRYRPLNEYLAERKRVFEVVLERRAEKDLRRLPKTDP